VTEALRIDLLQSPTVRLAEPGEVIGALWRMGRDPAAGLPEELAREAHARLNALWHSADPALRAHAERAGRRAAELSEPRMR